LLTLLNLAYYASDLNNLAADKKQLRTMGILLSLQQLSRKRTWTLLGLNPTGLAFRHLFWNMRY